MQVSARFTLLVFWLCLSSFIYGFHISALNSPQSVIICPISLPLLHLPRPPTFLPSCLDITTSQFGFITAAFTFGGLFGCLSSPVILPSLSIKRALILCAVISLLGGLAQSLAPGLWIMLFARALTGFGAALGICVVPPALGLIAPEKIRGSIGVLHQLSIVTGILLAQLSGLYLSQPSTWRYIPFLSSLVCFAQLLLAPLVPSPEASSRIALTSSTSPKLSSRAIEEEGLLAGGEEEEGDDESRARRALAEEELVGSGAGAGGGEKPMGVWEILVDRDIRRGVLCCLGAMLLQQFSGINAVFFFSVSILTPLMPTNAPLIALYLTVFNFLMTFPAVYLVERLGRRTLLLGSIAGMGVASLALGMGLNGGRDMLSAVGVFGFVSSRGREGGGNATRNETGEADFLPLSVSLEKVGAFAIGLGPVPFIIISELVPSPARSSLSSLSLLINFLSNLAIGALFLPVRMALSSPHPTPEDPSKREGEGTVFYLFAGCLVLGVLGLGRGWRA